jgi:photosystem II stability/assembly factor-like uncharacterized protein
LPFPVAGRSTLHAILVDPAEARTYFVAVTSEMPRFAGVYRSQDGGNSWEQLPDLKEKQVWSLSCWKRDSRVIAAGAQDGVYLSRDSGRTWKMMSSEAHPSPQPVVSLAFDPLRSTVLYAGTPHLAWKTTDGGATWHALRRGMQEDSDIFSIEVNSKQPYEVLAGACSGVYRSADGGGSWTSLEGAIGGQHRTYFIARHPTLRNALFAGTAAGLFVSLDGSLSWRKTTTSAAYAIAFEQSGKYIVVATDHGVLRTEDLGRHFVTVGEALSTTNAPTTIALPRSAVF